MPLNQPVVYTTDRSKAVVPMLFLFCVALVYTTRRFMFGLALLFVYVFSVLLAFWSPCLGKRELVFVLIVHLFVSYAHGNLCHFFSSSWCRLRLLLVALPGLFNVSFYQWLMLTFLVECTKFDAVLQFFCASVLRKIVFISVADISLFAKLILAIAIWTIMVMSDSAENELQHVWKRTDRLLTQQTNRILTPVLAMIEIILNTNAPLVWFVCIKIH